MRLLHAKTPARRPEEAAMTTARLRSMSGGAALNSILCRTDALETVEVTSERKNAAAGENVIQPRRRSALRHVLERQF